MVSETGVEPARAGAHRALDPARLPFRHSDEMTKSFIGRRGGTRTRILRGLNAAPLPDLTTRRCLCERTHTSNVSWRVAEELNPWPRGLIRFRDGAPSRSDVHHPLQRHPQRPLRATGMTD